MAARVLRTLPAQYVAACTRSGVRCSITAATAMVDQNGRPVAEPLRRGGWHCAFHIQLFCTTPARTSAFEFLVSYLDLETSGSGA